MSKSAILSRVASLFVVALWICLAAWNRLPEAAPGTMSLALFVGLPLIWLPETIGSLTGYIGHGPITLETPPVLVAFAGWLFLVGVPLIAALLSNDTGR
jgi:hypothetical protein